MKNSISTSNTVTGSISFKKIFDFETNGNVFTVYAPNGVMKTSFANTFRDISKGTASTDRIWSSNETKGLSKMRTVTNLPQKVSSSSSRTMKAIGLIGFQPLLVNDTLKNATKQFIKRSTRRQRP